MKKRVLAIVLTVALVAALSVALVIGLTACDKVPDFRIGLICLHDEKSTYDLNFIEAMERARKELGLAENQIVIKTNIAESEACYNAAVDLVEDGCDIIFADSFGHESYMIQAAKEYPNVQFCHATGTNAHTENLDNYHNAFASIYEGRYLAGVAAGLKLRAMGYGESGTQGNAPVVGYVGAFTYAEVISGYTSWFLGVRSIISGATMKVSFTGSWYDETKEKAAAETLITDGCVLISQHADSMGAPTACKEHNVPNVTYNVSTKAECANTYVAGCKINWTPYYVYAIKLCQEGKGNEIVDDYVGTIETGSVELLELGNAAAADTQATLDAVKAQLVAGTLHVFDTTKWTKDGQALTTYTANVNTNDDASASDVTPDTEAISNGYFHESEYRSAPYFDIQIDGITLINVAY